MKCIYYLSPTLASTESISDDLHTAGVNDWFMHIISMDEAGLSRKHLHSSNYLETLDIMRDGLFGAVLGFLAGLICAGLAAVAQPFGTELPAIAYIAIVFLVTCFGAWVGGLVGISTENRKLEQFHGEVEAGNYLILVYAGKQQDESVRQMMARLHPEAQQVGYDSQFYNPFSKVTRIEASGSRA